MALVQKIKIQIDDKEIKNFVNLNLQQSIFGHHSLEIVCDRKTAFEKNDGVIIDNSAKKLLGGKISLLIKVKDNEKVEFEGIVTGIHASKPDQNQLDTITIEAAGMDILLDDGAHSRSFEEKTLKAIAEKIISEYNLSTKNIKPERSKESLPYTVQFNESSYDFLSRMASKKGEWFYYDGKDIVFGERKTKNIKKLEYGVDISELDLSLKLNDYKFKYISRDYLKDELYEAVSDVEKIDNVAKQLEIALKKSKANFKHETIRLYNHPLTKDKEDEHLKNRIKLEKSALAADAITCSGSTEKAGLKLGDEINIVDYYDENGKKRNAPIDHGNYIITELSHTCSESGAYENTFSAVPKEIDVPPYTTPHAIPFCETQSAIVMDNNDPEKLGRVQVQFFWQKPENTVSPWLRIVTPHSGKDQGFFFTPEIGDEVLVAFEGGNAEKPYIIGSHYHGKAKPDQKWINDNNDIKGIRTKGGHTIEFVDKDGGEELKIYDNKNDKYEITLSAHSSTVTIKSSGDLNLKADGDIKIEAGSNLNLKAGSNMEIKAGNELKTSAMSATSEATTNMELKANTGMKLNGGAQLEQTAAIIRIN